MTDKDITMKQYQTLSIMMLGMMLFTSCGDTMKTEPLSSQPQKKDIIQSSLVGMWLYRECP